MGRGARAPVNRAGAVPWSRGTPAQQAAVAGAAEYARSMSCIRFNTPAQRQALLDYVPVMLTAQELASQHPAPAVTESKIRRLRLLAIDANPKIRESAASNYHSPADLLETLSRDADEGVRICVARNEYTPCDVLRAMADDASEQVRGWLAVNYFVPADVMQRLAEDDSSTVRSLVKWKGTLVEA